MSRTPFLVLKPKKIKMDFEKIKNIQGVMGIILVTLTGDFMPYGKRNIVDPKT